MRTVEGSFSGGRRLFSYIIYYNGAQTSIQKQKSSADITLYIFIIYYSLYSRARAYIQYVASHCVVILLLCSDRELARKQRDNTRGKRVGGRAHPLFMTRGRLYSVSYTDAYETHSHTGPEDYNAKRVY